MSREVSMQFGKPGTVSGSGGGVNDTGWINAELESVFVPYGDAESAPTAYRKIGNIVFIRGEVKPSRAIAGSVTEYPIFYLPSTFRPSYRQTFLQQGSAKNSWLMTVNTDGSVCFSRYGTTANAQAGTTAWLIFSACFAAG